MQKIDFLHVKKLVVLVWVVLISANVSNAQSVYLPYSYQLNQKFNSTIYSVDNSLHTSLKPFLIDSTMLPVYNAVMNVGVDTTRKSWVKRKLFNEHLFDEENKEYTFYGDYLPDLQIGRAFAGKKTTYLNTRGIQVGGTVGPKFYFYSSFYENQGQFPAYYDNYINKIDFVPGQAKDYSFGKATKDWAYVTALISYTPIKQLNITLGEDKTFIGDGYRSLLLSDFAANYPFLRLTANVGKVQYMLMWAYMEDMYAKPFNSFTNNRRKWALVHYLDWNVTNRLSLGFFNALIAQEADDNGNLHGFDVNFINPLVFSSSLGPSSQPDNVFMGFTGKYKIFDKTAIYSQVIFDRFQAGDFFANNLNNTNGFQVGLRGADLFKVKNFNYLFEFNTVKPYTYTSSQLITNYTEFSQSLGDPIGANFREFLGILNYSIGRFDFMGQLNYAKYGLDPNKNMNFGQDVTKVFSPSVNTTTVGQGIPTNLYYAEGTVSLLINPNYNLRLELGGLFREQRNDLGSQKTTYDNIRFKKQLQGSVS